MWDHESHLQSVCIELERNQNFKGLNDGPRDHKADAKIGSSLLCFAIGVKDGCLIYLNVDVGTTSHCMAQVDASSLRRNIVLEQDYSMRCRI